MSEAIGDLSAGPLSPALKAAQRREWWRQRAAEWVRFDSPVFGRLMALAWLSSAWWHEIRGDRSQFLRRACAVHRGAFSPALDSTIERRLKSLLRGDRPLFEAYIRAAAEGAPQSPFVRDPNRLLGTCVLVLKSPSDTEKGLISLSYSFAFPLFAHFFDIPRIARQYHLVLEPSWSGYCDLDILCYLAYDTPVFVQAPEPRDADFIARLDPRLIPVPIAANWWVDHRVFRPLPDCRKDADVIMVAGWSKFKRHRAAFGALAKLRAHGRRLKVILAGYPGGDMSKDDVLTLGRYYGIRDQLELHEYVPPDQVNLLYNRARVNLLWSRREGCNRAIVEGFFAGTPTIIRQGFNYGHRYEHINERTGRYAAESELPDVLREMVDGADRYRPREWAMENMTCQRATEILDAGVGRYAQRHAEVWTRPLAVKVGRLDTMTYWDEAAAKAFDGDYEFLRSARRLA